MNIGIIGSTAECTINFRKDLILDLIKQKHNVFVFANNFDRNAINFFESIGAHPINYKLNNNNNSIISDIINIFYLGLKLRKFKIDLTISYFLKPIITTSFASKIFFLRNNYIFFEGLGSNFGNYNLNDFNSHKISFFLKFLLYLSIWFSQKSIFINKEDLIEISKINKKVLKNSFILGPIGLDLDYYKYAKLNLNKISFIYIGRIHYEKGIINYIEAAHLVNKKFNNINFTIVGEIDPKSKDSFKKFIENQKNYKYLHFIQYQKDIREILKKHTILILPTFYREGSPRTIQESIALGRPFITTNIPGCKILLDNGRNGFECSIDNTLSITKIIFYILKNKSDLISKNINCKNFAKKNLNTKNINNKLIKFLNI